MMRMFEQFGPDGAGWNGRGKESESCLLVCLRACLLPRAQQRSCHQHQQYFQSVELRARLACSRGRCRYRVLLACLPACLPSCLLTFVFLPCLTLIFLLAESNCREFNCVVALFCCLLCGDCFRVMYY